MRPHAFVDETMRGGYLMVAALLPPAELPQARKAINVLVLPGQRRLHFCSENDTRRGQILSVIRSLTPEILVYKETTHKSVKSARPACLERLVEDLAAYRVQRVVLERDNTTLDADRRWLYEYVRRSECEDSLTYVHQRAHEEPLLAIPDAAAWSWTHKGRWRVLLSDLVSEVHDV